MLNMLKVRLGSSASHLFPVKYSLAVVNTQSSWVLSVKLIMQILSFEGIFIDKQQFIMITCKLELT